MALTFSKVRWETPLKLLSLKNDDVHVWLLQLNQYFDQFDSFLQHLSPEELEKASRYYFQRDRESFTVTRAMAKAILGGYLDVAAREVRFHYNPFGKPALAEPGLNDLRFNLSHSNDLALLAIARGRDVGVDLEYRDTEVAKEDIAREFFSTAEFESITKLPKHLQLEGFFKCWTCKEAYIKAIGKGLSFPLDKFTVSVNLSEEPKLLEVAGNNEETDRWVFWDVSPNSRYSAAVVAEGCGLRLNAFEPVSVEWSMAGTKEEKTRFD